jgi:hypothetical protein
MEPSLPLVQPPNAEEEISARMRVSQWPRACSDGDGQGGGGGVVNMTVFGVAHQDIYALPLCHEHVPLIGYLSIGL